MDIKVAFLIDGSFFLNRLQFFKRKYYSSQPDLSAEQTVQVLNTVVSKHLESERNGLSPQIYRVFFYDAPPLDFKVHLPIRMPGETKFRIKDFSKDAKAKSRNEIFELLKRQRKYALRLGHTQYDRTWRIYDTPLNKLLKNEIQFSDLTNDDFYYAIRQKGVDIKLGLDIATLTHHKLVDKIILVTGDSDFVPAAKFARTGGIDFVLDPLENNIAPSLHEHTDGLVSFDVVTILQEIFNKEPDLIPAWWNTDTKPKTPTKDNKGLRSL